MVWEKCDYTFPAGFIATFGGQETCGRVASNRQWEDGANAKRNHVARHRRGWAGVGRAGGPGGLVGGGGRGWFAREHQVMRRTVFNVSE